MERFLDIVKIWLSTIGACVGAFVGDCNGLIVTLVAFVVCDYISGVLKAVVQHKLNSEVGAKGIVKKVLIFIVVGIANMIDTEVLHCNATIRTAAIFFYIANEGISILENASVIGLPVPIKLQKALEQLREEEKEDGVQAKEADNKSK